MNADPPTAPRPDEQEEEARLRAELLAARDALRAGDGRALRATLTRLGLADRAPLVAGLAVLLNTRA